MHFGFPVFGSKTKLCPWFCLSFPYPFLTRTMNCLFVSPYMKMPRHYLPLVLFPPSFQFSLETQSSQILSTKDTFSVGKGGGQQRWHSNDTSESTVLGTRLIVTSCPPVASCWWRDTSWPSLTSACRWFGHDETIRPKGDDLCPYGWTLEVSAKGSGYRHPHWEASKGRAS